jgi:hypothetical protein
MIVAPFDAAEGSGPAGRVREVYRLAGTAGARPPGGPGLEALPDAYGMRLLAIHPRSGIKPSAYSLASVQLRNFATQVGVSLRGGR